MSARTESCPMIRLYRRLKPEIGRIVRFGLVGLVNTGIGLGTIYLLQIGFGVDYRLANTAGYALGIVNSFVLNRVWTFKSRDARVARQGTLFLLVAGACWALQLGAVILLVETLTVDPDAAQPLGMVVYTGLNYLGNRFFVFKASSGGQRP